MLLSETRLADRHIVNFRNFCLIRSNKIDATLVGTAILLRDNIKHEHLNISSWQLQALECTVVLIRTTNRPMCIISAYRHSNNNTHISHDITIMSDICNQNQWDLIIGGDFNAKHPNWSNTNTCNQGRALANWLLRNAIQRELSLEFPQNPTFRRSTYSSVLDFFIISSRINITRGSNSVHLDVADFDSDHHAVLLTINLNCRIQQQERRSILNYKAVNWSHFKNQLDSKIQYVHIPASRNLNPSEIDQKLDELNNAIKNTISEIVPIVQISSDNNIILPQDVLDLIAQKKRMRRRWERLRVSGDASQLRTEIKLLTQIIDERIICIRNIHYTNMLSSIRIGPSTFQQIKSITKSQNSYKIPKSMVDPITGNIRTHTVEIVNILGNHFENVHRQNEALGSATFTNEVNSSVTTFFTNNMPRFNFCLDASADSTHFNVDRHLVSVNALKYILKSRANKRSTGHDGISNIILRKLSDNCITKIAILFNQMFNICHFPSTWKHAVVIPICKPGKPENASSSYRPISLLPCLSKVYERALKEILEIQCEDKNILPDDQFGFRSNRSTSQALVIFKNDISTNFNSKTPTIACATDIEKAFDTVWRQGLIHKIHVIHKLDVHICRCIHNYLLNRTFQVKINDALSQTCVIDAGVPQGAVLSALLYIIYIADMPLPPQHLQPIRRLQYADDMLLYVSAKNLILGQERINMYIKTVIEFLDKWKIKINPEKCEAIVFKGPCKRFGATANKLHDKIIIKISNTSLIPQRTFKYLGVWFSKNLTHVRHIDHIIRKINTTYSLLKPLLKKTNGLNKSVKLLLYKQLIRPIIGYGFPSWSDISSHQMERLRSIERVCLRACTNTYRKPNGNYISNSKLIKNADIERIDKILVEQAIKFFNKNYEHCQIIQRCFDHDADFISDPRTYYKPPWYIEHLNNTNNLFSDGRLLHYHKRIDRSNLNTVYNTEQ